MRRTRRTHRTHRLTKNSIICACILLFAACASKSTVNESRQVLAGAEQEIDNFYFTSAQCEAVDFTLELTKPPSNGVVEIRPSTRALPSTHRIGSEQAKCTGKTIASKKVFYTPNSGYIGPDSFEVLSTNNRQENQQETVRFSVEVLRR